MQGHKKRLQTVDYTDGPILGHLLKSCPAIFLGIVFQSLCLVVDTYCVSYFSAQDVAAVSAVFTLLLLTSVFSQVFSSGGIACLAPIIGSKDKAGFLKAAADALNFSLIIMVAYLVLIALCSGTYLKAIATDSHVDALSKQYLLFFLPALVLPLPIAAMSAFFRASGMLSAPVGALLVMIVINIVLAPCLTFGWLISYPLGVVGTAIASSVSNIVGLAILFALYVRGHDSLISLVQIPSRETVFSISRAGIPASGEILIMFVVGAIIYSLVSPYGADAQAGLGIGSRTLQLLFWPALSAAFATAPIIGQNHGIKHKENILKSINYGIIITSILMCIGMILIIFLGYMFINAISADENIEKYAITYMKIKCLSFVPLGISMVVSNALQALGRSGLSFGAAASQMFLFGALLAFQSTISGLSFVSLSIVEVSSYACQAILSLYLLCSAIRRLDY
ncbi:MATE family efflux transporter [Asaia sp. HN128]